MHTSHNTALSRGATPKERTGLFNGRERALDREAEKALARSLASLPSCAICKKRIPLSSGYAIVPAGLLPLNTQHSTLNTEIYICDSCLDAPLPDPPAAALRAAFHDAGAWKRTSLTPVEIQIDVDHFETAGYMYEPDDQLEAELEAQGFFNDQAYLEGQQIAELLDIPTFPFFSVKEKAA